MSIPTKMEVQLLGKGDVILFSISMGAEMNTNFVVSAEELVETVNKLVEIAASFPESPLNNIKVGDRSSR